MDTGGTQQPAADAATDRAGWRHSLSVRLFWLTIGVILIVEALIFVPSAAAARAAWLQERAQAARIATLALETTPTRAASRELSVELFEGLDILAVTELEGGMRFQILPALVPMERPVVPVDIRAPGSAFSIVETCALLFAPPDRTLMILARGKAEGRELEILVPESSLREELGGFFWRILGLSLIISFSAGIIVYLILLVWVVRPMRAVTQSVEQFRDDPGGWNQRLEPTTRRDEIGRAQKALAEMEAVVSDSFRQRERLAELGEAVARINHDLRGSLAAAQLVSDTLARSEDPRVQRAVPRLERALERAIGLATQTLQYGKAKPPAPQTRRIALKPILTEAAEEALASFKNAALEIGVPETASAEIDPDHLHRIAANLVSNAAHAMEGEGRIEIVGEADGLLFIDHGPGLPPALREALFKPFASTNKRGGTGLGLAIARDLARAMGGDLSLARTGETGTAFRLTLAAMEP